MNYKDLFKLKTLLNNNPNISRLSNKIKLKIVSFEQEATTELKILSETEDIISKKYNLSKDDQGTYMQSMLALHTQYPDSYRTFQKELGDLQEEECKVKIEPFLSEDEYCTLTDRQEIKKWDGTIFDFYYGLSDMRFLQDLFMIVKTEEDPKQ